MEKVLFTYLKLLNPGPFGPPLLNFIYRNRKSHAGSEKRVTQITVYIHIYTHTHTDIVVSVIIEDRPFPRFSLKV